MTAQPVPTVLTPARLTLLQPMRAPRMPADIEACDARGVLVVLYASHECVTMRGGRQPDASTVTIAARGELAEPAARAELVALIGASRA